MSEILTRKAVKWLRRDVQAAEPKWQQAWADRRCFAVNDGPADGKAKYYVIVTILLDSFAFDVAVARRCELANAISNVWCAPDEPSLHRARFGALEIMFRLVSLMMQHLTDELRALMYPRSRRLVAELPWSEPEPALLSDHAVPIAIQVNGKLRGTVVIFPDADAQLVVAGMEGEPNVLRALEGKRIVQRIKVPNHIVNVMVAG